MSRIKSIIIWIIIYLLKKSCHYNFMKTNIFTILLSGIIMICGIENRKRCQSQGILIEQEDAVKSEKEDVFCKIC